VTRLKSHLLYATLREDNTMSSNINNLIFVINVMILTFTLFIYIFFEYSLNDTFILFFVSMAFILLSLFSLRGERYEILKKNYFKHSTLVLLGIFVVSFQKYIDFYLGYIDKNELLMQISEESVAKSLIIVFIGLISFFIGYLLKSNKLNSKSKNYFKGSSTQFLTFLSIAFLLGFLLTVNPLYVMGGYGIHDIGNNAIYFSLLFKASYFALIIQKLINSSNYNLKIHNVFDYVKFVGYFNIGLFLVYISVVLLSGDRGDFVALSLLLLIGYINSTGEKISRFKSILMICVAAFFITLLGVARSFNTLENASFTSNISKALSGESNKHQTESILPFTAELGDSAKALHYSVEYVPTHYEYLYSRFHFQAILGIIPFSSYISPLIFNDTSEKYTSSDSYITWLIEGENPQTGHGTSMIADFYLSYGVLGVIFGMGFFGWLIRYCEQHMQLKDNKHLILLIISVVIFSSSIYLARSSLLPPIRLIVWIWILMLLNEWLNKRLIK